MKLRDIAESFMAAKIRDALASNGYFNRPLAVTDQPFEPTSGHDASSQNADLTSQATGVPRKLRHRRYLGMETRPGTIRL